MGRQLARRRNRSHSRGWSPREAKPFQKRSENACATCCRSRARRRHSQRQRRPAARDQRRSHSSSSVRSHPRSSSSSRRRSHRQRSRRRGRTIVSTMARCRQTSPRAGSGCRSAARMARMVSGRSYRTPCGTRLRRPRESVRKNYKFVLHQNWRSSLRILQRDLAS